jgi:acyl dehydratase
LFTRETVLHESGRALATILATTFARGDGGFGGPPAGEPGDATSRRERAADVSVTLATWPNQALFYRLCGDRNPLHADPEAARKAGFERPILHGMCTFGMACHAILRSVIDYRCEQIAELGARFVAPVFPGDTLRIKLWRDAADVRFEVDVENRESVVLRDGRALLRDGAAGDD